MKKTLPLISIVVPVYNVEKYLHRCIESILAQSYKNIELVLIDDGSKDSSGAICDNFAKVDKRVKVFHQKNQGASAARNNGIKKSNGEYLQFVDADDWLEADMTASLYNSLISAKAELVLCGYTEHSKNNKNPVLPTPAIKDFQNFIEDMNYWVGDPIIGSPCNKLFIKKLITDNKLNYPVGFSYAEDYIFNLRYLKHVNSISILKTPLYNYYIDTENSLSKIKPSSYENVWKISQMLIDEATALLKFHKIKSTELLETLYCFYFTFSSIQRIKTVSKKDYFNWITTERDKNKTKGFIPTFPSVQRLPRFNLCTKFAKNLYRKKFMNLSYFSLKFLFFAKKIAVILSSLIHCFANIKNIFIKLLKKVLKPIRSLLYRFYYDIIIKTAKKPFILCECYMMMRGKSVRKNNWGDDLNYYFFKKLTDQDVINIPLSIMYKDGKQNKYQNKDLYCLIGSIVTFYNLTGKIVYGSGIMNPAIKVRGVPKKIISVRGPKTRDELIKQGIDCPANYGDPALLLPCLYKSSKPKHKKIVLIPNHATLDSDSNKISQLATELDAVVLDLRNYDKWTDPIDTITGASFIISESLHGLIVAEAYGIPSVWVKFIPHPAYWDFKFQDFYESIGKNNEEILELKQFSDMKNIYAKLKKWKKAKIDFEKLKSLFPFPSNWDKSSKD